MAVATLAISPTPPTDFSFIGPGTSLNTEEYRSNERSASGLRLATIGRILQVFPEYSDAVGTTALRSVAPLSQLPETGIAILKRTAVETTALQNLAVGTTAGQNGELTEGRRRLIGIPQPSKESVMTLSDIATDRRSLLKLALLAWGVRSLPVYGAAPPVNSKVDPQQIRNAAGSNNQLSADLYQALGKTPGNLFFSPASIAVALAMTADGAAGQTRQEMFQVLHGDEQADAWLKSMGELAKLLNQSGDGYTLELANRLWGQAGFHFEADYVQRIGQSFDAPLGELPFTSNPEASRGEINRWVSSRTHDRIQDLLPEGSITTLTRMVLTNAIYFKADWADEFDGKRTRDLPFVRTDGSRVDAPMMFQKNHFPYGEDEAVQVLEMPYKSGSLSMVVVLPKQNDGLPKLATSITGEQLERWVSVLRTNEVELTLPKFKLQTQFSLKTTLSELGMARAFSDDAEFTRISKAEPLQISDVIHKAFVEVDEKGTEAAAATGVIVATRAAIITKRIVFQADHPFLFFIRHQETGAILFVGHVSDPRT